MENKLQTQTLQKHLNGLTLTNSNLSIRNAMKGISLSAVIQEQGAIYCEALVMKLISEMSKLVRNDLTPDTIVLYAKKLISEFQGWKIEEIVLAVKNGTASKYGKIFGSVTYDVLCEWLWAFDKEKEDFLYHQHLDRKNQTTGVLNDLVDLGVKIPEFKAEMPAEAKRTQKNNNNSDIVQGWMKQFDKIYSKSKDLGGMRMIKRYGKLLDQTDFLKLKLNQYERIKSTRR